MALKKNPKYDLKSKYKRTFKIGLIVSLFFQIAAFKFFPSIPNQGIAKPEPQILIALEDVVLSTQKEIPPAPPKPLIPIEAPGDIEGEYVEIPDSELDPNDVVEPPKPPVLANDDKDVVIPFYALEKEPAPIGGIAAIRKEVVYPTLEIRAGIQGTVYVLAVINKNGDVEHVEIQKGISGGCDEEAMRVIKNHKFYPGEQRGKPVKTKMTIPIKFVLK